MSTYTLVVLAKPESAARLLARIETVTTRWVNPPTLREGRHFDDAGTERYYTITFALPPDRHLSPRRFLTMCAELGCHFGQCDIVSTTG
jgi:hypothetical protein